MKSGYWLIATAMFIQAGCASIDYVGKNRAPTDHVDIYYSRDRIVRSYEIMGRILASSWFLGAEKIQAELLASARERGADGVVIEALVADGNTVTGPSGFHIESSSDKKPIIGITRSAGERRLQALLIRYTTEG